ncbi:transcription factor bHLH110 [Gossypium raimondii]|uniref:BHLH domain-containing protein n=2 Tax=Gossypium raimondii TaxID=29730 RepID=A0A0D2QJG8_GOSRA|nr:transcription factor bHLH110 [Gossypium raimondii]KJB58212.1 hypothetical protein B456_009G199600 [Gossypium raimondii]
MEPENAHHQHHLQDQLLGSSSSLPISPCYGVSSTHSWTPTTALNSSEFNPSCNGDILHSRLKNDMLVSPQNSSMIQGWTNNEGSFTTHSCHGLHLPKIKDELSESITKFTDILSDSTSSVIDSHHLPPPNYLKNNEQRDLSDLSQKLLLKTISSGFPMFSTGPEFYSTTQNCSIPRNSFLPSRGSFSQIYPSINISSLNQASSSPNIPSSFDMNNMEALDLLNPARFSRSSRFSYPSEDHDNLDIYKEISPSFGLHYHHNLQQSSQRPVAYTPSKTSPFPTEITEAKRPSILPETKPAAPTTTTAKKSRLESRASCPPFKVRKEKLGDRIAALQQLVAPFGKTDTASVLMEAIGYIKFLQNQVETLSVPYMKLSRNKTSKSKQGGSTMEDENEEDEARPDLRSRGLCLVPLSCMSYMTSESGGGGIWPPPPNFTG